MHSRRLSLAIHWLFLFCLAIDPSSAIGHSLLQGPVLERLIKSGIDSAGERPERPNRYVAIGRDDRDRSCFLQTYLIGCRAVDHLVHHPNWVGRPQFPSPPDAVLTVDAPRNHQATRDERARFKPRSAGRLYQLVNSGGVLSGAAPPHSAASARADEPAPRTDENSKRAHEDLLRKARLGATTARIDVYFIGDSITRRWGCTDPQYRVLLDNWKKNFAGWHAANFGWGGDTTNNILWRLNNGELNGLRPKVFVILAGTNNLGPSPNDADAEDVARGIKAIIATCQRKVPEAKIILTAIFPRNDNRRMLPAIRRINERIAKFADSKQIHFLNVDDKLADADGNLLDGMMMDGLHPTRQGYQVWADALRPLLTEFLGPPDKVDRAPPPTGDPSAAPTLTR